jgi:hypothetical protein
MKAYRRASDDGWGRDMMQRESGTRRSEKLRSIEQGTFRCITAQWNLFAANQAARQRLVIGWRNKKAHGALYEDAQADVDIFMSKLLKENPSAPESHRYLE